VVRVPDAEVVGLGFNPWVGHFGDLRFPLGEVTEKLHISQFERNPKDANQPKWLECVDNELSALAVKTLSA